MDKKKISLKEIGLPKLALALAVGVLIIILSIPGLFGTKKQADDNPIRNTENEKNGTDTTNYESNTYIAEMEEKLESIFKKVSGIGDVKVMITLKASQEKVPLKDEPSTQESVNEVDGEGGSRTNNNIKREESTVLVTNEDGNLEPYIIQELEPEVEGIVVIAEGGDNGEVILDIMEAAEVLFGVPAHKVKVMKMGKGIN